MSDEQRRALERGVASGDAEARVRVLAERVRLGELPRERVELAAWCGDEVARAVAPVGEAPDSIFEWLVGVERFGREACVRVLAAAAHAFSDVGGASAEHRLLRNLLQGVDAWLECPCDSHARAVVPLTVGGGATRGDQAGIIAARTAGIAVVREGPWVRALEHAASSARELRERIARAVASWALDSRPVDPELVQAANAVARIAHPLLTPQLPRLEDCGFTLLARGRAEHPALDRTLGRAVTLAFIDTFRDLRSLWQEFLAGGDPTRIHHPNVRRVLRHGTSSDGRCVFFASEVVRGPKVADWLRERERTIEERLRVARGLARGVAACVAGGVMPSSLSAASVTLRDGEPVVDDLGFGLFLSDVSGSDPEMADGPVVERVTRVSPAASVVALARVLNYVLAETRRYAIGAKPTDDEPDPLLASVPPSLVHVLRRGLSKNPEERPPVDQFVRLLEELVP